jgi:hypothetical protein
MEPKDLLYSRELPGQMDPFHILWSAFLWLTLKKHHFSDKNTVNV